MRNVGSSGRPYKGHWLTEEQKKLAEENLPFVWWFIKNKLINTGKIDKKEIDEIASHLMWRLCLCAEKYNTNSKSKFSSYLLTGCYSGFAQYKDEQKKYRHKYVFPESDFFKSIYFFDTNNKNLSYIELEDIWLLFKRAELDSLEKEIIFLHFIKSFTLQQIGKMFEMSKQKIRGIIKSGIDKCKNIEIEYFIGM